jgi:hypothetical protein
MPVTAPFATREGVAGHNGNLRRIGMTPVFIVAGLPATMGRDEDPHARVSEGLVDGSQVGDQSHLFGDGLDALPEPVRPDAQVVGIRHIRKIDTDTQTGRCPVAWELSPPPLPSLRLAPLRSSGGWRGGSSVWSASICLCDLRLGAGYLHQALAWRLRSCYDRFSLPAGEL